MTEPHNPEKNVQSLDVKKQQQLSLLTNAVGAEVAGQVIDTFYNRKITTDIENINESRIANKMEYYSTSTIADELAFDYLATYQKAKKELADRSDAAAYREAIAYMVVDALPSEYYQVAKKFVES
jgi:hypothetical protein